MGEPIPSLGAAPEISAALSCLQPNGVSDVIVVSANKLAVVELTERIRLRLPQFSEVEERIRDS